MAAEFGVSGLRGLGVQGLGEGLNHSGHESGFQLVHQHLFLEPTLYSPIPKA